MTYSRPLDDMMREAAALVANGEPSLSALRVKMKPA